MMRTLAVRLDSLGDVLVTGPALRALAASSERLSLLAGPLGLAAAELLPGVDELLCWRAPWIDPQPEAVRRDHVESLRVQVAERHFDRAVVFTSFHQSALPTALVLRMAGVPWVGAISEDYPGSLLDLRLRDPGDVPEPERALALARACGAPLPAGDDGGLAVRPVTAGLPAGLEPPYVVLHPGTSVPARAWPPERFRQARELLVAEGHRTVVTGAPAEQDLTRYVVGSTPAVDLGGRTSLAELAAVLAGAQAAVAGNTGPAHLAAAVRTPVVSLFAPTVPAVRWAPYAVPRVLLGDQDAPCRGSRATTCPLPGHPCLASVTAQDVLSAVTALCGARDPEPAR